MPDAYAVAQTHASVSDSYSAVETNSPMTECSVTVAVISESVSVSVAVQTVEVDIISVMVVVSVPSVSPSVAVEMVTVVVKSFISVGVVVFVALTKETIPNIFTYEKGPHEAKGQRKPTPNPPPAE